MTRRFYPPCLPQRKELAFAAKTFNSIEINATFYSLHRPESFVRWAAEPPDDFLFAPSLYHQHAPIEFRRATTTYRDAPRAPRRACMCRYRRLVALDEPDL